MNHRILLADDEVTFRETFTHVLEDEGFEVAAATNGTEALELISKSPFAVAILDIQMPGADGIKVLREIKKTRPEIRVIMITAYGTVEMAVEAMKLGACDYVMKPVLFEDILTKIRQHLQYKKLEDQNRQLKDQLQEDYGIENIIGQSQVMQEVFSTIRKVAQTKSSVLLTGESGTGKELAARAIHSLGPTREERFVAVNCGAIPETLLESELFGHKKGSFTSAIADKKGLFEVAHEGTLFLDEIGHMPFGCQVKLLRAVEERMITPVGGIEPIPIDVRLISATNRNLLEDIQTNEFREELYYRISVVNISLPALRDRKEDIPLLAEHFIRTCCAELGKTCEAIHKDALQILLEYDWKGNVRELQNVIERAVIFAEGSVITAADIGPLGPETKQLGEAVEDLRTAIRNFEKSHVHRVLQKYERDKPAAAKALGVGVSSLYRKIEELGIQEKKRDKKVSHPTS